VARGPNARGVGSITVARGPNARGVGSITAAHDDTKIIVLSS
jgi:hypothetical protein